MSVKQPPANLFLMLQTSDWRVWQDSSVEQQGSHWKSGMKITKTDEHKIKQTQVTNSKQPKNEDRVSHITSRTA